MSWEWPKNIVRWKIGKTLYLSIPFTWLLPSVEIIAAQHKGKTIIGGPAVNLMPDYFLENKKIKTEKTFPISPLCFHNPLATFTTRGCPNKCEYCAVPKIEGDLIELKDWEPKPIICDNNLLAASRKHFDKVIDKIKIFQLIDFNQGLDARLFTPYIAERITELKHSKLRFACDNQKRKSVVAKAIKIARSAGLKDISVYVLIGYKDTPDEALDRLTFVRDYLKVIPNPMRFQPLDSLKKDSYVADNWTNYLLKKYMNYWARQNWLSKVPFEEYKYNEPKKRKGFGLIEELTKEAK